MSWVRIRKWIYVKILPVKYLCQLLVGSNAFERSNRYQQTAISNEQFFGGIFGYEYFSIEAVMKV